MGKLLKISLVFYILLVFISGCSKHELKTSNINEYSYSIDSLDQINFDKVFEKREEIKKDWWELLNSNKLKEIIEIAYKENPSIKAAYARLNYYKESLAAQKTLLYPQIDFVINARRQRTSSTSMGMSNPLFDKTFTTYSTGFVVSYNIDLFGLVRSGVKAKELELEYNEIILKATYLTLTGNVILLATREAFLREEIKLISEIISLQNEIILQLTHLYNHGAISEIELINAKNHLNTLENHLTNLTKTLQETRNNLISLLGINPAKQKEIPEFYLTDLKLPEKLPYIIPSTLIQKRPDIIAQEKLLNLSIAHIGVAHANLFPDIVLNANLLYQGLSLDDVIAPTNKIWNLGISILTPIINSKKLHAQKRMAINRYEETLANYEQVVISALIEVSNILINLVKIEEQLNNMEKTKINSQIALNHRQILYDNGKISIIKLLQNKIDYINVLIEYNKLLEAKYTNAISLFIALGGGWS